MKLEFLVETGQIAFLTKKQRNWVVDRDDGRSQVRHYSEEKGWHLMDCDDCDHHGVENHLNVHHIVPRGVGGGDESTNLITTNECEHVGRRCDGSMVEDDEQIIHPPIRDAFKKYRRGNKKAFKETKEERTIWNKDHDAEMSETARERTQIYAAKGKKWP